MDLKTLNKAEKNSMSTPQGALVFYTASVTANANVMVT